MESTCDTSIAFFQWNHTHFSSPAFFSVFPFLSPTQTAAERSAAALDVHVGHFSDPVDLPGLAHFCEHMLFLGEEESRGERGRRRANASSHSLRTSYVYTYIQAQKNTRTRRRTPSIYLPTAVSQGRKEGRKEGRKDGNESGCLVYTPCFLH